MLLFIGLLVGITALAIFTAGLLAILRSSKSSQNRWFFTLAVFIAVWTMANFIDSNVTSTIWTDLFLKLDFISALFIAWAFLEFSDIFLITNRSLFRDSFSPSSVRNLTLLVNLLFTFLALDNRLVTSTIGTHGLEVHYTSLIWAYLVVLLFYFGYAFAKLLYKRLHLTDNDKSAINLISNGIMIAFATNILTNLIFPALIQNRTVIQSLNLLGYLGILLFVVSVYLAISTQRLFDIRLVVARSLAYITSLVILASLYGFVIFGVARFVFNLQISIVAQVFFSAATAGIALAFQPLRKVFDKATNKIFYQDAYDPEVLFDKLNRVLVSTLELDILLSGIAQLLDAELKAEFCAIGIKEIVGRPHRLVGTLKRKLDIKDVMQIRKYMPRLRQNVIGTDYLMDKNQLEIKKVLMRNDIAVLVQLTPNLSRGDEGLGYLILGSKKSGNPYTSQDFRVLDTIANELIIAIQNALHFEEIQNFNMTLQEKVVDATKELRRTNDKLKTLDETKDDFISMASHQLRTPLTSVKGYLSMVLDGDAGKLTALERKMLTQAFISSQRMVYLISDLLNVSRLKTGKFIIERTPVNLADMISDEIAQLKETAATRSLKLEYDKPKTFPSLDLDETKTRQVVMNFIDNAIYYTPAGGRIRVELEELPTTIELRVVDDGIGVPKAEQHHLFTKFYRAGNARKARPDGTGLGLFMARKVVIAQGGAIVFRSIENKGSTFGFSFPKTPPK